MSRANSSPPAPDPFEAALARALADRDAHGEELRQRRRQVLEAEERDKQLVTLARTLVKALPEDRQAVYLRRHPWLSDGPDPASRHAVLVGIIQLFLSDRSREWTPPEVEDALATQGIHANTKRVYNSLNYLSADGRLHRIGRGRYRAAPGLAAGVATMREDID